MNRSNGVDVFDRSPRKSSGRRSAGRKRVGLALLLLMWIGLPLGCEREIEEEAGATVNEITETPNAFIGRQVTVSGEIKEVYGPRAFTIKSPDPSSGELLVVTAEDFPSIPDRSQRAEEIKEDFVQITGKVRRYIPEEIQQEIGAALDPKIESEYPVSHPVVIAESLHFTARKGAGTEGLRGRTAPGAAV